MSHRIAFLTMAALGFVTLAGVSLQANAQNREKTRDAEPKNEAAKPQQGKMMMQCPMMDALKSLRLPADAPPVLLAQDEQLQLTAEQKEQLQKIAEKARQQAREVLNEEQHKKLEQAPSGPLSPMQLANTLMKGQMGKKGDGQGKPMCPMCKKMMEQGQDHHGGKHEPGRGGSRNQTGDR